MDNKLLKIINLLNEGYYLKGSKNKKEDILIYKENDKINVSSSNYNLTLNNEEFISLYKEYEFNLIKEKEELKENKEKDLDYYSRLQKKG